MASSGAVDIVLRSGANANANVFPGLERVETLNERGNKPEIRRTSCFLKREIPSNDQSI